MNTIDKITGIIIGITAVSTISYHVATDDNIEYSSQTDRTSKQFNESYNVLCRFEENHDLEVQLEAAYEDTIENIEEITTFEQFRDSIGFRESSDNYKIVNEYGYMGRYQFGKLALKDLKIPDSTSQQKQKFLSDTILQDKAFKAYCQINKYRLRHYIKRYDKTWVHGVYVTESGLLAGAHLLGSGEVKKWLRSGNVGTDANGTKITSYIKQFSGYNTAELKAEHTIAVR